MPRNINAMSFLLKFMPPSVYETLLFHSHLRHTKEMTALLYRAVTSLEHLNCEVKFRMTGKYGKLTRIIERKCLLCRKSAGEIRLLFIFQLFQRITLTFWGIVIPIFIFFSHVLIVPGYMSISATASNLIYSIYLQLQMKHLASSSSSSNNTIQRFTAESFSVRYKVMKFAQLQISRIQDKHFYSRSGNKKKKKNCTSCV